MKELVQAIAVLLDSEYGHEIYIDNLPMGFNTPCFFIEVINSRRNWVNGKRYQMQVFLNIYYFPHDSGSESMQITNMASELYNLLDVFDGKGRKYKGTSMSHTQNEDCLVFSFSVNYHTKAEMEMPLMADLFLNQGTKKGENNGRH